MKEVSISGSLRENVGKKDAKKLRREGKIICVVYGGKEQQHFTVKSNDFKKLIFTPEVYIINLELDGKTIPTILREVQYHPVSDKALHADFLQLTDGRPIIMNLPVKIIGAAPGIEKGGVLNKKMRLLPVKGLITEMPDNFTVDISSLEINDTIQIRDIDFGKLTPLSAEGLLVVGVKTQRGVVEEEEEEEEGEEGAEGAEGEGESSSEEAKSE